MAKFVYRMQNVLDIKLKMEDQAKANYANARNKAQLEQEKLELMFQQKKALEDEYRDKANGSIHVQELLELRHAIDYQKELIKVQLVELRVAEKNVEMARIRLSDVMKDRKTHEKLREKAFENFLLELSAEEKKEIDELVSYRYGQMAEE